MWILALASLGVAHALEAGGVSDFLEFNFGTDPDPAPEEENALTPWNLPWYIEDRLRGLAFKQGWRYAHEIREGLGLPNHNELKYKPFSFKYVFEYARLYGTVEKTQLEKPIADEILLSQVSLQDFVDFFHLN